jgi:hypothetical protein
MRVAVWTRPTVAEIAFLTDGTMTWSPRQAASSRAHAERGASVGRPAPRGGASLERRPENIVTGGPAVAIQGARGTLGQTE